MAEYFEGLIHDNTQNLLKANRFYPIKSCSKCAIRFSLALQGYVLV